jgi:hypothetical protein
MNSIIGNIRDFFSDNTSKLSAIQYSEIQSLSLNNVPLITYLLIGVTTVILASHTIIDYGNKEKEGDDSSSMMDKLPSTEGIKETLSNFNPFKSSSEEEPPKEEEDEPKEEEDEPKEEEEEPKEEEEEPKEEEEPTGIVGGRRKHKKKHTHKKVQTKNKKSHKNKK